MRCPFCNCEDTQVKDSRPSQEGAAIRRRRLCPGCEARFTTYERVQLRDLVVIKSDQSKQSFDREKLRRSIAISLRKRPIDQDAIDQIVSDIVGTLERKGEGEVTTVKIGEAVMDVLAELDQVAYIRFASVYRNFREAKDFGEFVGTLDQKID
jgi:transcriptional repressor NrdR